MLARRLYMAFNLAGARQWASAIRYYAHHFFTAFSTAFSCLLLCTSAADKASEPSSTCLRLPNCCCSNCLASCFFWSFVIPCLGYCRRWIAVSVASFGASFTRFFDASAMTLCCQLKYHNRLSKACSLFWYWLPDTFPCRQGRENQLLRYI